MISMNKSMNIHLISSLLILFRFRILCTLTLFCSPVLGQVDMIWDDQLRAHPFYSSCLDSASRDDQLTQQERYPGSRDDQLRAHALVHVLLILFGFSQEGMISVWIAHPLFGFSQEGMISVWIAHPLCSSCLDSAMQVGYPGMISLPCYWTIQSQQPLHHDLPWYVANSWLVQRASWLSDDDSLKC